ILPRLFLFFLLLFQNPFDTCIVLGQRLALFLFIRYLIFMLPLCNGLIDAISSNLKSNDNKVD
uniref:hypothetical protein n=1 Tax=Candidatus Bandiella numerosa TaxID=2570586 RepID=UPI001F30A9D2